MRAGGCRGVDVDALELRDMSTSLAAVTELEPAAKTRLGAVGMLVGTVMIGVVSFVPIASGLVGTTLGIVGVGLLVAGVLLVGTSSGSV